MSSAALEHLAWIELNFERGIPSAARDLSNRDSGMEPHTPTVKFGVWGLGFNRVVKFEL